MMRTGSAVVAAFACLLFVPRAGGAAVMQTTSQTSSTGTVQVQAFNGSLGLLLGADLSASYSGVTGTTTLGSPPYGHSHSYSGGAGPLSFGGSTGGPQLTGPVTSSWSHNHAVSGNTSTATFADDNLAQFSSNQSFAAGGGVSTVGGPTGPHSHSLNASAWNFLTTVVYTYLPAAEVLSMTINATGNSLVLPDFDESLGTLVRADVDYTWNGQTQGIAQVIGTLNGNNHAHSYNLSQQGFDFSGTTSGYLFPSPSAPHNFSGSASRTITGSDLSLFDSGSTISFSGLTGFSGNHNHFISPSQTNISSEITLYYMANDSGQPMSPVPEPSSLALMGLGILGLAGRRARRRRSAAAVSTAE